MLRAAPKNHTAHAQNDRTDRRPPRHGERHQGPGHGRRAAGGLRPSRHADGHGRRRHRPVLEVPEVRRLGAELARPRPLHPVGRPRLDAALFAAASDRLRRHDARRAEELPPARQQDRRPSRVRPRQRHRDHDRPARPGPRQLGGLRHRRAPARRALRPRSRRPLHLCHRRRRLPDGGRRPGGDHAGGPSRPRPPDRAVRRQRHLDRRPDLARDLRGPQEALRRRRLARAGGRRPRPRRGHPRHPQGAQRHRQALADRLQDGDRLRRADQGRHRRDARLAARQGRGRRRPHQARLEPRRRSTFPSRSSRPGARSARAASRRDASGPSGWPRCRPRSATEFARRQRGDIPAAVGEAIAAFKAKVAAEKPAWATRKSSQEVLEVINPVLPDTIGGSADLTGSNNTKTGLAEGRDPRPTRPAATSITASASTRWPPP